MAMLVALVALVLVLVAYPCGLVMLRRIERLEDINRNRPGGT